MTLAADNDFSNRELSVDELDAIAAGLNLELVQDRNSRQSRTAYT